MQEIVSQEASEISQREQWGGAAERGLQARLERERIIKSVLVEGVDYAVIPGTTKPTLHKPGAEKIADCLNLYPDYEELERREDWDRPLFHYRYRCVLRTRGSGVVIATGIGSCNSMEGRYRWRHSERVCPACGEPTIIKGKAEFGGGWLCWAKKGGCGKKFSGNAQEIVGQNTGKVENEDVFTLVNTIDKMAQKRAMVAASLNLGFSQHFTQDLEDGVMDGSDEGARAVSKPKRASKAKGKPEPEPGPEERPEDEDDRISEAQRKRLFAMAMEAASGAKDPRETAKVAIQAILDAEGIPSQSEIFRTEYETVCEKVVAAIQRKAASAAS